VSSPHLLPCIFNVSSLLFAFLASVLFSSKFLTIGVEKGKCAFMDCKGVCHHRSYPWSPILKHLKSRYAAEPPFKKCFGGVWKSVNN
jgi:hypothetical protein